MYTLPLRHRSEVFTAFITHHVDLFLYCTRENRMEQNSPNPSFLTVNYGLFHLSYSAAYACNYLTDGIHVERALCELSNCLSSFYAV